MRGDFVGSKMIKFSIGGRTVDPKNIKDAMMAAILENIRAQITEKVGTIRDPDTGEFPTVIVRGDSIDNLRIQVEGAPTLVTLVRERLGMDVQRANDKTLPATSPSVFLSYASDDLDLARRIAEALQASGIETWWDRWCIYPGDSLRQKIDEGIAGCTHFLVLLTPQSIGKPWVNQEMDAGLVGKLNDRCKFLPVRFELPASNLPPLLSGMHSPVIAADEDISQLVNDIYGISRKPPLGSPPAAVQAAVDVKTGYSAAATALARFFVEKTKHGLLGDPHLNIEKLTREAGLTAEDTADALYELSGFVKVSHHHAMVQGALFAEFDRYWMPWDAADDALRLAADIMNDSRFPHDCKEIAQRYGWEPRRLNPVVYYLLERNLIVDYRALGTQPWAIVRIVGKADEIRRFLKGR
jgi:TIR domain